MQPLPAFRCGKPPCQVVHMVWHGDWRPLRLRRTFTNMFSKPGSQGPFTYHCISRRHGCTS